MTKRVVGNIHKTLKQDVEHGKEGITYMLQHKARINHYVATFLNLSPQEKSNKEDKNHRSRITSL